MRVQQEGKMKALKTCTKQQRANEGWKAEGFPLQRENPALVTESRQEAISTDISGPAGGKKPREREESSF